MPLPIRLELIRDAMPYTLEAPSSGDVNFYLDSDEVEALRNLPLSEGRALLAAMAAPYTANLGLGGGRGVAIVNSANNTAVFYAVQVPHSDGYALYVRYWVPRHPGEE